MYCHDSRSELLILSLSETANANREQATERELKSQRSSCWTLTARKPTPLYVCRRLKS